MYLDQIKAELQEAADVLDKFMHDEKNIQLIHCLSQTASNKAVKCSLAVMVAHTVMLCTLQKN